jgi:hypothetical protein
VCVSAASRYIGNSITHACPDINESATSNLVSLTLYRFEPILLPFQRKVKFAILKPAYKGAPGRTLDVGRKCDMEVLALDLRCQAQLNDTCSSDVNGQPINVLEAFGRDGTGQHRGLSLSSSIRPTFSSPVLNLVASRPPALFESSAAKLRKCSRSHSLYRRTTARSWQ